MEFQGNSLNDRVLPIVNSYKKDEEIDDRRKKKKDKKIKKDKKDKKDKKRRKNKKDKKHKKLHFENAIDIDPNRMEN